MLLIKFPNFIISITMRPIYAVCFPFRLNAQQRAEDKLNSFRVQIQKYRLKVRRTAIAASQINANRIRKSSACSVRFEPKI